MIAITLPARLPAMVQLLATPEAAAQLPQPGPGTRDGIWVMGIY
jgi:hypothetical protein